MIYGIRRLKYMLYGRTAGKILHNRNRSVVIIKRL